MKQVEYASEFGKKNIYGGKCPILYALDIIGQKWKLPVLWHLMEDEKLHYNELKRKVGGITNTMLTKSLRELEMARLVLRCSYDTVPPSVDYRLTERGRALIPALNGLYNWGKEQMEINK